MRRVWVLMAMAVVTVFVVPAAASAKVPTVDVCHIDDEGVWHLLAIPAKGKAVFAHHNHGDGLPGLSVPGMAGYSFDETCAPVQDASSESLFALAYTDLVDDGNGYDPASDVVIAKLVDGNGDGVANAGDTVLTYQYPEDTSASAFGNFTVTEHVITGLISNASTCLALAGGDRYSWTSNSSLESYLEANIYAIADRTLISDSLSSALNNTILINPGSPSAPTSSVSVSEPGSSNDQFVDIDLNCLGGR